MTHVIYGTQKENKKEKKSFNMQAIQLGKSADFNQFRVYLYNANFERFATEKFNIKM